MVDYKTTMQLPGGIPMPVLITGVQDTVRRPNNWCTNGHDPVAVKSTTACPTCTTTNKEHWKLGFKNGDGVTWVPEEANPKTKADHSIASLTAHSREEVDEISMVVGKVYAVLPARGSELLYANIHEWILSNPKVALLTTWGPTAIKTYIWVLEASMGKILIRELAHPSDVRNIAAPTELPNAAMVGFLGTMFVPAPFEVDTYADHNAAIKAARTSESTDTNVSADALMASLMAAAEAVAPKKTRKKAA